MELGHPELQRGVWASTPQATRWADGQAPLRSYVPGKCREAGTLFSKHQEDSGNAYEVTYIM